MTSVRPFSDAPLFNSSVAEHHGPSQRFSGTGTHDTRRQGEWDITEAGHRFVENSHRIGLKREDFGPALDDILNCDETKGGLSL